MRKPVVGLLPLYVELYDASVPEVRPHIERHLAEACAALEGIGLTVLPAPVCRLAPEFEQAVTGFEEGGADAIVTLHLAYSPSLESEAALARTKLPLIVLDTTPNETFDEGTDPAEMMFNHGIHGVQDMCNRLIRQGKPFEIHAGHLRSSDVLERLRRSVWAAMLVSRLRHSRVGLVGEPFTGMGDFVVGFDELQRDLGLTVVRGDASLRPAAKVPGEAVAAELEADAARFEQTDGLVPESHEASTRAGLVLREWADREGLTALTVNFMATSSANPALPVMPFLECSKAMERGLGYAGEGDVLTAAWVGALLQCFPDTTFTEMFCPDWRGGAVFLSHMGEFNYRIADGRPRLTTLHFPYTDAGDPAVAYSSLRGGPAILANLSPFGQGRYRLTISPGHVRRARRDNRLSTLVNGWFVPDSGLIPFLEEYSRRGASHHSALVYTGPESMAVLMSAARFLELDVAVV